MARVKTGDASVPRTLSGLDCDLFDRNREPSDQPRNLVQLLGILRLNGLGKQGETLVIAHRGYVIWHDRRHRPDESGQQVWHRITSNGSSGAADPGRALSLFGARFVAGEPLARPVRCPIAIFGSLKG